MRRLIPALALVAVLAGCASETPPAAPAFDPGIPVWDGWAPPAESDLVLESTDFVDEGEFPASIELDLKCGGPNVRPELHWSGAPEATVSYVVIFSYESTPETRWLAYDIPASVEALPAGEEVDPVAQTSHGGTEFFGPCSLPGEKFRLWFTVYALDTELGLPSGAAMHEVREAGAGHVLAAAELAGFRTGATG